MTNITMKEIIKGELTMNTIYRQELNSCADEHTMLMLFQAYTHVVLNKVYDNGCEYADFYKAVLNRFEESV